jgi:hypothetical protein
MNAAIAWLSTEAPKWWAAVKTAWVDVFSTGVPDGLGVVIALVSLSVSVGAFLRTARDSAIKRKAHSRAATDVARELLPTLVDFLQNPRSTEAKAVLETRGRWRELERFATMAGRRTRKLGRRAVASLNAWEEAWRDYNYNPHTDERHANAQRTAGVARDLVASLATTSDGPFLLVGRRSATVAAPRSA